MSQENEAQIKFYKTREDKELDKVIAFEKKVKILDDIVYKTGQSVQTMNMLNRCYNDNLALVLTPESDETIQLPKSRIMSKSFEALQKHAINLELDLQQCKEKIKKDKSFKENQSKEFLKEREQYFEIQDLKAQLQDKGIALRVIPTTSVSRPQLKRNRMGDSVMPNNSQGKKQEVEDHRRKFKTRQPMVVPISTREPKHNVNQSVATFSKKIVATDSIVNESRNISKKLYEQVSKTCSWWYQSVATFSKKIVATDSIVNESRNISKKLYEQLVDIFYSSSTLGAQST
ncbi:hypothetical protein Tco_0246862 [Tanacetum coccineum]